MVVYTGNLSTQEIQVGSTHTILLGEKDLANVQCRAAGGKDLACLFYVQCGAGEV